jgi:hypothetical protein
MRRDEWNVTSIVLAQGWYAYANDETFDVMRYLMQFEKESRGK